MGNLIYAIALAGRCAVAVIIGILAGYALGALLVVL